MAKLTGEIRRLIVVRLATFTPLWQLRKELKDEHGLDVPGNQILYYDADSGSQLNKELRALFKSTREKFIAETETIAVAHKSFRLRELFDLYSAEKKRQNYGAAAQMLEQAAKEMGNAYTNRRVLSTGDPLKELAQLLGVPPEAIAEAVAGMDAEDEADAVH